MSEASTWTYFGKLVRIWYDPVNAHPKTGGLAGRWTLNSSDGMVD